MLDGKQIRDATITAAKFVAGVLTPYLRADGTVTWSAAQNAGSQRLTNLGAPVVDTDAARLADIFATPWKDKCTAATTANVNLATGTLLTIDGIVLTAGQRVCVRAQTAPAENGIYIAAVGAWARASDADSASELRGAVVTIEQGTLYADHRFAQTSEIVTLGTTAVVFVDIGTGTPAAFPTTANKVMAASLTTTDFQVACATTITFTPASDSYVRAYVNGVAVSIGDGVKTRECYASSDGGTTAKTIANIAAGDLLYWVGSVALYQLATTDVIDLDYLV